MSMGDLRSLVEVVGRMDKTDDVERTLCSIDRIEKAKFLPGMESYANMILSELDVFSQEFCNHFVDDPLLGAHKVSRFYDLYTRPFNPLADEYCRKHPLLTKLRRDRLLYRLNLALRRAVDVQLTECIKESLKQHLLKGSGPEYAKEQILDHMHELVNSFFTPAMMTTSGK